MKKLKKHVYKQKKITQKYFFKIINLFLEKFREIYFYLKSIESKIYKNIFEKNNKIIESFCMKKNTYRLKINKKLYPDLLTKTFLIPYFKDAYRPVKKGDTFIVRGSFKPV